MPTGCLAPRLLPPPPPVPRVSLQYSLVPEADEQGAKYYVNYTAGAPEANRRCRAHHRVEGGCHEPAHTCMCAAACLSLHLPRPPACLTDRVQHRPVVGAHVHCAGVAVPGPVQQARVGGPPRTCRTCMGCCTGAVPGVSHLSPDCPLLRQKWVAPTGSAALLGTHRGPCCTAQVLHQIQAGAGWGGHLPLLQGLLGMSAGRQACRLQCPMAIAAHAPACGARLAAPQPSMLAAWLAPAGGGL